MDIFDLVKNLTQQDPDVSGSTSFLESHAAFLWQALKESANLLMKAVAFYLAIAAAILGYVLSHPVAKSLRVVAALTIMLATALFTIAVGSVAWGLWTGVRNLQRAQEMLSPGSFAGLEMASFFTRARIVFWIIIITSLLVLLILLTAIAYSLFQ